MRGLGVGKQAPERVANASRIADLGEGLHELGVNADATGAFMQKLKIKLVSHCRDGARIEQNLSLRRSGVWGSVRSVRRQANSFRPVRAYIVWRVFRM
jgi:hypothetical protein